MLEILITLSSLMILPLLTKMYWHLTCMSFMLLTMKLMTTEYMSTTMMVSEFTMTDLISVTLMMLSMWITALMMLASYKIFNSKNSSLAFIITCNMLLITLIISFYTSSILMFYIAFEASLIPTMILIMSWGYQPERLQASMYLMIYTVTASLPLLMMVMKMYGYFKHLNMSMPEQMMLGCSNSFMTVLWLMIIMAFLVKLPMFMVHLWLPKAHVEAPVAGSMILAAVLLKLGGYGLARMIMIYNYLNKLTSVPMMVIALVGGALTSLICLRQSDMKSLIAYSSIGHMGLMLAGMMSGSKLGLQASLSMMLAHGLSSSAMFCMANITYMMTATRSIALSKGMLSVMPVISFWWFMFCCANMAAPPSINLMSEIFLIMATMSYSQWSLIPITIISFITAAYSLYLYSTVNHGQSLSSYNSMPNMLTSDMLLNLSHFIPIILLLMKSEMIISWC